MAKAEKTTVTTETITLTLTMEEAEVLRAVTGAVAGLSPQRSAADRVYFALEDANVESNYRVVRGSVTFDVGA